MAPRTLWDLCWFNLFIFALPHPWRGRWTWSAKSGFSANRSLSVSSLTELRNIEWRSNVTTPTSRYARADLRLSNVIARELFYFVSFIYDHPVFDISWVKLRFSTRVLTLSPTLGISTHVCKPPGLTTPHGQTLQTLHRLYRNGQTLQAAQEVSDSAEAARPCSILRTRRVQAIIDLPHQRASFGRQIGVERGGHKSIWLWYNFCGVTPCYFF